ncbi:MAG: hypothetical protein JXA14_04895 [Anaerolineae bacterium]|nr:hypothetical protein [Anaerolineae bacterium]
MQIYRLLLRTNCQECGYPTCLACAVKRAARQAPQDGRPRRAHRGRPFARLRAEPGSTSAGSGIACPADRCYPSTVQ